jgi:DNA-binding response OmpR family regulator
MNALCPHCQQPIHRAPPELLALQNELWLPRRQQLLFDALVNNFGKFSTKDFLVAFIWDNEDEPDTAYKLLESYACRLRRRLEPHPWRIEGRRFSGYRLVEFPRPLLADGGANILTRHENIQHGGRR